MATGLARSVRPFWVAGFDMIYACQDAEFDREAGLNSIPARFGVRRALRIAAACHAVMIVGLVALGWSYPMGLALFHRDRGGCGPVGL